MITYKDGKHLYEPPRDGVEIARGPVVNSRVAWVISATPEAVLLRLPHPGYDCLYADPRVFKYSQDAKRQWFFWRDRTFEEACDAAFQFIHDTEEAQHRLAEQVEVRKILEEL